MTTHLLVTASEKASRRLGGNVHEDERPCVARAAWFVGFHLGGVA